MERHYIPRYLWAQPQIVWWELDEFLLFIVPLVIGNFANQLMVGIAVGAVLSTLFKKFKEGQQEGFLYHFLYWHGLWKRDWVPPSWLREYVE